MLIVCIFCSENLLVIFETFSVKKVVLLLVLPLYREDSWGGVQDVTDFSKTT